MFYCRQVLGFCRSLEEEGQCMHEWLLKTFINSQMDWAHKMDRLMWKPYRYQCFQSQVPLLHVNNPFKTTLSSSHLSYQLFPKETPQEANSAMVDSLTFSFQSSKNPFMSKSIFHFLCSQPWPFYLLSLLHHDFTYTFHLWVSCWFYFFTMILHNHLFCTHIGWCRIH